MSAKADYPLPENISELVQKASCWRDLFYLLGHETLPHPRNQTRIRTTVRAAGVDVTHFHVQRGPRRGWTVEELVKAIDSSSTWSEAEAELRLRNKTSLRVMRRIAQEEGIDTSHLDHAATPLTPALHSPSPQLARLPRAGELLAMAWYTSRGYEVSTSPASSVVDFIICDADGNYSGIQVKTTSTEDKRGQEAGWPVSISRRHQRRDVTRRMYSESQVQEFFVITLGGDMYRIPRAATGDNLSLCVGPKYSAYRVGSIADII